MVNQIVKTVVQGEINTREYFLVKKRDSTGKLVPFDLTLLTIKIIIYDVKRSNFIVHNSTITQDLSVGINACYYLTEDPSTKDSGNYLGRLIITSGVEVIKTREFQWNVEKVPAEPPGP